MRKVAFCTLGCKVNQYESEAMSLLFVSAGYEVTDFSECADVYVINTCTVTHLGDKKSRQMISRAKKINPNACISVVGCYAQTAIEEVDNIPFVNVIIGTQDRDQIVSVVERIVLPTDKINLVKEISNTKEYEQLSVTTYKEHTRAYVKIQDG